MTDCKIECKKCGIATAVAFVAMNAMEFVLHGVVLMPTYQKYMSLWNPQPVMNARRIPLAAMYLVFCALFTRVYAQGHEPEKGWCSQGLRFGAMAGVMVYGLSSAMEYMVYPVSAKLAAAWFAGGVAETAILGLIVAAIYRPAPVK